MNFPNLLEKTSFFDRWLLVKHSKDFVQSDPPIILLKLYILRLAAILLVAAIWVTFTLLSGFFTVGVVILIGGATGIAHFFTKIKPHRFHILSALLLTFACGVICNVLAGLAFFSSKMGVSYWQVLITNLSPENMQMLSWVFVQSVLPQDLIYYLISITIVFFFAQHSYFYGMSGSQSIDVQLINGNVYHMGAMALTVLLELNRVVQFKRSQGWAVVGRDPLRKSIRHG